MKLLHFRNKRLRGSVQSLSAITAALQSEDDDSDLDDEQDTVDEPVDEEPDNPRWQLYNAVRTCTNAQGEFIIMSMFIFCFIVRGAFNSILRSLILGVCLAEPFLKLPSKRYYANYYKEIRNPLSLFQIRKKLCVSHFYTFSKFS